MRHFYLTEHTSYCKREGEKMALIEDQFIRSFGLHNRCRPETFILYHNLDFFIITLSSCWHDFENKYDVYVSYVKEIIKKTKVVPSYKVARSIDLSGLKMSEIEELITLENSIQEINYLYQDNAGKQYAITTKCNFIEKLINIDLLNENFLKTKEYLYEKNKEHLIGCLEDLYRKNKIWMMGNSEGVKIKIISESIKYINKQLI